MERMPGIVEKWFKKLQRVRAALEGTSNPAKEGMDALQVANEIKTKEDALAVITQAKAAIHSGAGSLGYFQTLEGMASDKASAFGATPEEIAEAKDKGVDRGSISAVLGNRGRY